MRLGAYTSCLHDKQLKEALGVLAGLGLDSAEINSDGFLPPVHLPVEDLRSSETARSEYLALFDGNGVALTALNCNDQMEGLPYAAWTLLQAAGRGGSDSSEVDS